MTPDRHRGDADTSRSDAGVLSLAAFAYAQWRSCSRFPSMKYLSKRAAQSGKLGWILLWLLGVPIPILLLLFLLRGCT
jgi:hypothetical protein